MRVFKTPHELKDCVGEDLGATDWLQIDQERINTFADATGDHQWIHVDVEKAKRGPFGAPIAHGYLTASLANLFKLFFVIGDSSAAAAHGKRRADNTRKPYLFEGFEGFGHIVCDLVARCF